MSKIQMYTCPLCQRNTTSRCMFAWHYDNKVHCLYDGKDMLVTGKKVSCPYMDNIRRANAARAANEQMRLAMKRMAEEDDLLAQQ